ncbi:hypothetical protein B296_00049735, partial [Ensete ventricosum]
WLWCTNEGEEVEEVGTLDEEELGHVSIVVEGDLGGGGVVDVEEEKVDVRVGISAEILRRY